MDSIPDFHQLLQLAQSPAGQQLIAMLQQNGGSALSNAVSKASAGDYTQAKQLLSSLLSSAEAQTLLSQLEEQYE